MTDDYSFILGLMTGIGIACLIYYAATLKKDDQ